MSGTLYIVATPIGNLEDLSPRARQTLADADLVAAEDTRHTGRLLSHIGAKARQIALHDHNEREVVDTLLATLADGRDVALVSDAGTPLISDPGYRLVRAAQENGIRVSPVPGPSAVTAALSASGLPTDRFAFEGFLPQKQAARQRVLAALAAEARTMVFFESVHRVRDTLDDLAEAFGKNREAFVGRELTKLHEQTVRARLAELARRLDDGDITGKGEFVLVVEGNSKAQPQTSLDVDRLLAELAAALPAGQAAAIAARISGEKKNALYERLLVLKRES